MATLLAVSGLIPVLPVGATEPPSSTAHESSMAAPEGPQVSAVLSAAPSLHAAPLSPASRVVVAFAAIGERLPARSSFRPAGAMKPAPAILRI